MVHQDIEVKEFADLNVVELDQVVKLYSSSFLPLETKPIEKVLNMLRNDNNYRLFAAEKEGRIVGFSLLYIFRDLQFGLLDYLAVVPTDRKMGIGTELFRDTVDIFCSELPQAIGLFLEVQKEDVADMDERNLRKNRLRFYKKIGAKIITPYYLLPPQSGSKPEETYLMVVPRVGNLDQFPKEMLIRFIQLIHLRVYHYHQTDLLKKTIDRLPETVKLTKIQI